MGSTHHQQRPGAGSTPADGAVRRNGACAPRGGLGARRLALAVLVCTSLAGGLQASDALVPFGSNWAYLDSGSPPAATWTSVTFDDSSWSTGPAELGYGDGDEATVVGFGPNPNDKFVTTWFRHAFTLADASPYVGGRIRLVYDDGAIVYLNGVEILRTSMPAGAVDDQTLADSTISGSEEGRIQSVVVDVASLVTGDNVLAVEVHQRSVTSSDVSLDAELIGFTATSVTRGPYLQTSTDSSVVVRWRTAVETDSRVTFGAAPDALFLSASDPAPTLDHAVTLTGLAPETTYYYAVGTTTEVFAGADVDHVFQTAPAVGPTSARVWVLGDSGTANPNAAAVRDAYAAFTGATPTDLILMLGDNAYDSGTASEYQAAVFEMYADALRRTPLWPARGNHDTKLLTYEKVFTLPADGEAGGVPSGTESYYSFDHGNVHFMCLDSFGSDRSVGGAMHTWLEADLAANTREWLIAYWHHPPYSKGSHDSDTETELIQMRANFLPLLEDHGVDLVLCGHSHAYERSFLIDGHYGNSNSFGPDVTVDGGDGDPAGDGAYVKLTRPHAGAVYTVAGSSGKLSDGEALDHEAMAHSVEVFGSVVLDIAGDRIDVTFLDAAGTAEDTFQLRHVEPWTDLGNALAGSNGLPSLTGEGTLLAGAPAALVLAQGASSGSAALVLGVGLLQAPFKGGVLVPTLDVLIPGLPLDGDGGLTIPFTWPPGIPAGATLYWQYWIPDAAGPFGWSATNGLASEAPEA